MKKFFVLFTAVALICAFSMPAAAMDEVDYDFYGSARMATFWIDSGMDEDLQHDLQGNSRFGANVNYGDYGGGFEFAVNDESGVNTRKLFGTANLGGGQLLIGQTYTPISSYFYSNQVFGGDEDLLGTGQLYASRRPMIQFKMAGFKFALVEPGTAGTINFGQDAAGNDIIGDVDNTLPKVEFSYGFKTDMFFVDVSGGYQTVDTEGPIDESWDSLVGAVGGGVMVGPVTAKVNFMYAENGGLYGVYSPWIPLNSGYDGANVVDNEAMGYLGVVNFKASDMLSFEVGAGYREVELGNAEDDVTSYYANAVIKLLPTVFFVPEFGVIDIDSADDELTYFGLKSQINF